MIYKRIEELSSERIHQRKRPENDRKRGNTHRSAAGLQSERSNHQLDAKHPNASPQSDNTSTVEADEDEIDIYSRIRLPSWTTVKWDRAWCNSSLEISLNGLGVRAVGTENIMYELLGWSVAATRPLCITGKNPRFPYFEVEILDGGSGK